jgi:hypothetical protein
MKIMKNKNKLTNIWLNNESIGINLKRERINEMKMLDEHN